MDESVRDNVCKSRVYKHCFSSENPFYQPFRIKERDRVCPQHYILLLLLLWKRLRTHEILLYLQKAGYPYTHSRQISHKLARLKERGLIEKDPDGAWRITEYGERIAEELFRDYEILSTSNAKILSYLNTLRKDKTDSISIALVERKYSISIAKNILEKIKIKYSLSKEEAELLKYIIENYLKYNVSYLYGKQILEKGYHPQYFVDLARRLRTKGLIYIYVEPDNEWKLGLKQDVRDYIKSMLAPYSRGGGNTSRASGEEKLKTLEKGLVCEDGGIGNEVKSRPLLMDGRRAKDFEDS